MNTILFTGGVAMIVMGQAVSGPDWNVLLSAGGILASIVWAWSNLRKKLDMLCTAVRLLAIKSGQHDIAAMLNGPTPRYSRRESEGGEK